MHNQSPPFLKPLLKMPELLSTDNTIIEYVKETFVIYRLLINYANNGTHTQSGEEKVEDGGERVRDFDKELSAVYI